MPPPEHAAASPAQDTGAYSITAQLDMGGNAPALKAYPAARCRCALPGFAGKAPAFETKPIVDFTGNAPCIEPKPRPDCTGTPQEKHSAAVLTQAGYHMQKKDNSGLTGTACGHDSAARILSPPLCGHRHYKEVHQYKVTRAARHHEQVKNFMCAKGLMARIEQRQF